MIHRAILPGGKGGPGRVRPDARIRVLQIMPQLGCGGAERQLLGLVDRLDRARFEVSVCSYSPMADSLEGAFRATGVRLILLDKFSMPLWRFPLELRRIIRASDPQVVHTWLPSAIFWGRWAAVSCGVRHIIANHRSETMEERWAAHVTERLLARRTVQVANREAGARALEKHYGLPRSRTRVIRNAVSVPTCDVQAARAEIRGEWGLPPDHHLVVMVARQHAGKNYPMFLRTARNVCGQRDDVTFVGVGRSDLQDELRGLSADLGVGDRVRLVGQRSDVHRWLAAADVFCLTSIAEGYPNAVLEAMMASLPVVCTAFTSVSEVVRGPQFGVVVPQDDDEAMAREVGALLDDPARRARMGRAARTWAEAHHTWDELVGEVESLYRELCGRRSFPEQR